MKFIGLDAGSVSVKLIVLDEAGNKLSSRYERHKGHPLRMALTLLEDVVTGSMPVSSRSKPASEYSLSVTGSAGRLIASVMSIPFTNEVVAHTYSTQQLYPHIRSIFELGGEDSKFIALGSPDDKGIKDFSMNSVCAAGTGSFLDQQAERLRLTIEEFSELALKSEKPSRIAGRCSVFAKSDMIHLQQIATPVEDIVAGLCFAVARNFKGSIIRGRAITEPVSFQGGVAANKGMVRAFQGIFNFKNLFVPDEFAFMGALGAALKDRDEGTINGLHLDSLRTFITSSSFSDAGHHPLISEHDDFLKRHGNNTHDIVRTRIPGDQLKSKNENRATRTAVYLGIDIGSISTNLAVIDMHGTLLAKRYLMTAGRPIEAVNQGLAEISEEIGDLIDIRGVGTTGSGRYMIADYVGADIVKNEITAQATAAAFIDGGVDTIFEIGGQDSKYISLRDGVIVDFEMNKACAAGTGSFLEEQAEKLNISVKNEFSDCACKAEHPCRLGERCTVFMENSLMANLQKGAEQDDLLAGLAYSIVQNYINKVVAGKPVGKRIFFQGGVAFNKSVVAAFEKYLGEKITVPPHHDVTGAIGMALIAMRHMKKLEKADVTSQGEKISPSSPATSFKGFGLSKIPYEISSFECKTCPNVCEINRVKIMGDDDFLFYGGRCEKYDVKRKKDPSRIPDLFAFREEMLRKEHLTYSASVKAQSLEEISLPDVSGHRPSKIERRTTIGIPSIFYFHDYLPFWSTLFWELGFTVEVSPKTNREIIHTGAERVLADTCFPVKVAHGHIAHLIEKGISTLLIPSFINMSSGDEEFDKGYACPLTQTIPYAARIAHPEASILAPIINLRAGLKNLAGQVLKAVKPWGITKREVLRAIAKAEKAQSEFTQLVKNKGSEILSHITDKTVVIVGRSYNAFESSVNLNIPKKLSDLGVLAIPMDFLPIAAYSISKTWPNMYWRSGQQILKAARFIRNNPNLYALFIGNFSCGPDSFILKYFEKEMEGKPFLQIEIDEHSADAGAITRCEAFLDSIKGQNPVTTALLDHSTARPSLGKRNGRVRTVYIPRMTDHAFAVAAAFERCGIPAEVLPESDRESVDIGRRYVSGKECYPCTVTTGDMLKKALSPDFRPEQSAFFMPSGSGPCRFGQYNVFHRMVLDEAGYHDIPIFAPNQDVGFYRELGIVGRDFSTNAWKGIISFELLTKCLHETRPYEAEAGSADALYRKHLQRLYASLKGSNGSVDTVLRNARLDFEALPRARRDRPLIGIVGEIFVRSHKFSNEDLVRKVEALGGEAWLAPAEEWIYYINHVAARKALRKKDKSAIIDLFLKTFFQKRIEKRLSGHFRGFLKTLQEPHTDEILKKASPYLHHSFEGEAILSIGKSVDLVEKGVSGIINAMPFGCMPGTVVTSIMRGVSRQSGIPCISIAYDGNESTTTEIQLEAFMNQAIEYQKKA